MLEETDRGLCDGRHSGARGLARGGLPDCGAVDHRGSDEGWILFTWSQCASGW